MYQYSNQATVCVCSRRSCHGLYSVDGSGSASAIFGWWVCLVCRRSVVSGADHRGSLLCCDTSCHSGVCSCLSEWLHAFMLLSCTWPCHLSQFMLSLSPSRLIWPCCWRFAADCIFGNLISTGILTKHAVYPNNFSSVRLVVSFLRKTPVTANLRIVTSSMLSLQTYNWDAATSAHAQKKTRLILWHPHATEILCEVQENDKMEVVIIYSFSCILVLRAHQCLQLLLRCLCLVVEAPLNSFRLRLSLLSNGIELPPGLALHIYAQLLFLLQFLLKVDTHGLERCAGILINLMRYIMCPQSMRDRSCIPWSLGVSLTDGCELWWKVGPSGVSTD